jgi:hypothetical protein
MGVAPAHLILKRVKLFEIDQTIARLASKEAGKLFEISSGVLLCVQSFAFGLSCLSL